MSRVMILLFFGLVHYLVLLVRVFYFQFLELSR